MSEPNGKISSSGVLRGVMSGGGGGTSNYDALENKPQINGVELVGNKSLDDLGIDIPTKTSDLNNDSGYTSSTVIAEAYDATSTYDVGAYVTHENNLYKCNTAITTAEEWNAEHWTLVDVISAIPTKTSELDNDSGFITGDNYYDKSEIDTALSNAYEAKLTQTLKVGENLLTEASVSLGANWSGTLTSGFTHTSGSTEPLSFNIATTSNKPYLISFNKTGNTTVNLYVKIGSTPDVDVYNGLTSIDVGIISDGGYLTITPTSTYNGTITNLQLREVKADGENEVILDTKSVLTKDSQDGISGYWNIRLGFDNLDKNENGSRNIAIGHSSLFYLKSGARNIALGTFALSHAITANRNIAIGADAMINEQGGTDNVAIGINALCYGGSGTSANVAIGMNSLNSGSSNTENIQNNVSIGKNAGYYTKANGNTFIGYQAGYRNKTGSSNVMIGSNTFGSDGGNGNTLIGTGISSTTSLAFSIGLGYQATPTKNQQMMLGGSTITEVVMCGNKKIKFNNDGTVTWEQLT